MAVALTGDFDGLERLLARAGRIAAPAFRRELLEAMAGEVNRLIAEGFDKSRAPDGKPWEPLKVRIGGKPLDKTGRLKRAAQTATPTAAGVMVTVNLVRAATHQYGAKIRAKSAKFLRFRAGRRWVYAKEVTIPARPFLPEGDLPPRWRDGLSKVIAEKLTLTLTR